jgi:hypothetical protein
MFKRKLGGHHGADIEHRLLPFGAVFSLSRNGLKRHMQGFVHAIGPSEKSGKTKCLLLH